MSKRIKSIAAIIIALCMIFSVIPNIGALTVNAASTITIGNNSINVGTYYLIKNGVVTTSGASESNYNVYAASDNNLYLNNAEIYYNTSSGYAVSNLSKALNVYVDGTVNIKPDPNAAYNISCYGINSNYKISIQGNKSTGTVNITAPAGAASFYAVKAGSNTARNIEIKNCKISVTDTKYGSAHHVLNNTGTVTFDKGSLECNLTFDKSKITQLTDVINTAGITMTNDSLVDIYLNSIDYSSYSTMSQISGIYVTNSNRAANINVTDSSIVVVLEGKCFGNYYLNTTNAAHVYGIYCQNTISVTDQDEGDSIASFIGTTLDCDTMIGRSSGFASSLRATNLSVSGNAQLYNSFVAEKGGTNNELYGVYLGGDLIASKNAKLNFAALGGRYSYGVYAKNITVNDNASFYGYGSTSTDDTKCYTSETNTHCGGAYVTNLVTVNNSEFTAVGGKDYSKSGGQSYGLRGNESNNVLINNGGNVNLVADEAELSATGDLKGIIVSAGIRGGIKNNYGRVVASGYTYGTYTNYATPVSITNKDYLLYSDTTYNKDVKPSDSNVSLNDLNTAIGKQVMDNLTLNKVKSYYKTNYTETLSVINFDAKEGSCSTSSITVGMDNGYKIKKLPVPTPPDGTTFIGWYPNSDLSGDVLTTNTILPESTTYYAKYSEVPRQSITNATVTPAKTSYTYTGSEIKPGVTVVLNGTTLKKDVDYTVAYSNNKNVGTATVTVTGVGLYKDTATGTFAINKANPTVTLQNQTITQGEEINLTNVLSIKFNNTEQNIGNTWYFYSDSAGNNQIGQPSAPGTYYYKAVTEETANFKPTESNIAKLVINKKNINVTIATYDHRSTYDGAEHTISVKCYADGVEVQGATVYYGTSNDKSKMSTTPIKYTDAGTYPVYAYCSYDGFESNVSQAEVEIFKATPELTVNDQRVSYSAAEPDYTSTVQYNGVVLSDIVVNYALYRDLDCTQPVQYSDINSSPGNYFIKGTTVETNNYKSTTAIANLTVEPAGVISLNINSVNAVYDGTEKTVTYTVSLNGQDVTSASTVTFTINGSTTQNAPKGTNVNDSLEFTAVASYNGVDSGIENGHISITKATPTLVCADVKLVYDAPEPDILYSVTFNGEAVQTGKTVKYYSDAEGVHEIQYNAIKNIPGTYYYRLTTDATDNFLPVSAVKSLTIGAAPAPEKIDISTLKAYVNGSFVYKGSAYKPVMVITDANGVALVAGTDYTLSYSNNINAGKATVTAKAKGDKYKGSKKATFTISARPVTDKNVKISKVPDQKYTGKAITPDPVIKFNGKTLKKGTDYTLSYSNNKKVGTASIKITGKGNFKGSKTIKFKIVKSTTVKTVTMYRIYNPNSGEHFYTSNTTEVANLVAAGWANEGLAWKAPEKSSIPVYRLYNENAGDHHYTMSTAERDSLVSAGWKYEGIGWYSDENKGVALYRLYNPNAVAGSHHYTTSAAERDNLIKAGWQSEGLAWYGVK